jgi:membrane fusion protein (multidrug efflux system)
VADSREESKQAVLNHETEAPREPWPEEVEDRSKSARAKGYFRQHPRAKWALIFLLIVLAVVGIFIWRYYAARESTDDAQIDGHIGPISSRVPGIAIDVYVEDNTVVHRGQILVQLDPKDYQVALERAEADLADAVATARAAQTGVPITSTTSTSNIDVSHAALNAAQHEVASAQAQVDEARANYTKASQDLKRYQQLVEKDEISQQQYDTALAAEQAARATLDAANSAVATAESHVAQAEANVRAAQIAPQQIAQFRARAGAAEAAVKTRQAAVDQAKLNLQYTTIRAPFDGVVSKRSAEPGSVVAAGQPLFSLVDLEDLWVTANFKETQLKGMQLNQHATVHVDAFARDYHGYVASFGGATGARFSLLPPENATGNFVKVVQRVPVRINFDKGEDPEHRLRPGMSVEPTVILK